MEKIIKAIIMLSPIIAFGILAWYSFKWEKKYKGKSDKELTEMNYFEKKSRNDTLLWLSGLVATILFILLVMKLKILQ
jgi:hypothetical protein